MSGSSSSSSSSLPTYTYLCCDTRDNDASRDDQTVRLREGGRQPRGRQRKHDGVQGTAPSERSKPTKGREGSSSSSSASQPPSVQTAVEHPDQFHNFYGKPRWRRYASCVLVTTALSILICLGSLLSIRLYIECQQPTGQNCIEEASNSIDDSEKPCDNLYEYVCGKYASALNTWFPNAFLRLQVPIFLSFYKKIMLEDAEAVREEQGEDSVSHKAVLMTQRCLFEAYDFDDLASCPSWNDYKHTPSRVEVQVLMAAHNIRRESVERSRPNVDLLQFEQW